LAYDQADFVRKGPRMDYERSLLDRMPIRSRCEDVALLQTPADEHALVHEENLECRQRGQSAGVSGRYVGHLGENSQDGQFDE